jgi:hypothetical protein
LYSDTRCLKAEVRVDGGGMRRGVMIFNFDDVGRDGNCGSDARSSIYTPDEARLVGSKKTLTKRDLANKGYVYTISGRSRYHWRID